MRKTINKLFVGLTIAGIFLGISRSGSYSFGQMVSMVPKEYLTNYTIQEDWNRLSEIFVDIDAESKLGQINNSSTYKELLGIMKRIFPYFPQEDYGFQLVYKQCIKTTEKMERDQSRENFSTFYENCKTPLANISNTITNKYTVRAKASMIPSSGPAPLTVTFDARTSRDPSNETIPARNYFWYYRDIDGIDKPIGIGPIVKHTFIEPGTYMVHLTVRSSNTGIFDGESTVSVNVSPKSAVVTIYANGKKMNRNKPSKIGLLEAKKGVFFDGSATIPMGGREILSHRWDISSRDGFKWSKEGDSKPNYVNIPLPGQGEYIVKLSVFDNEKNSIYEQFRVSVSDPVAIIQQNPEKGNTSTIYSFSSSASYSLTSRLKLYTWEIFDSDGNKLETLQGKNIKRQFKKPGNYSVKLNVEDEMGMKNTETLNIYVESTPPKPQFTITPTNKWKYPSEFYFDAGSSSDIDIANGYDKLNYERNFSNPNAVQVTKTENHNKKIAILFNEIGKHTITLRVSDSYGKVEEISKDISIESILRPELKIHPKASVWGRYMGFTVQTNPTKYPIASYEWDFGDGNIPRINRSNMMKYEYKKIGTYNVKVKVTDEAGNSNEVYEKAFIGEKDSPIIGYQILDNHNFTLAQNDVCKIKDEKSGTGEVEVPAFRVNRQENFTINTDLSVNAQGNTNQLRYYFQAKNDEIIKGKNFSHKFNRVGCQYIDYSLEDSSLGKITKERIWFKVVNALPTLNNLSLSFPQYGNEIGIGFQQNQQTKDIFSQGVDPIIIKVNAQGAIDPDGNISYFKRYYYPKSNPNKIIETKITPGNIPYSFFSVPKQPGEFMFGVKIFDNDDGFQTSDDILGYGPIVVFPPNSKQPDIPLVTLKSDKINVDVGDEVTFDIISKILSDRSDFQKERTIQIDFDGDGEIDLTTKNDRVKHVYKKPSGAKKPYIPKAYVLYRDFKGMGEGAPIVVRNSIKPALIYTTIGKSVIFRDVSLGNIIEREICLDVNECKKGNKNYINTSLDKTFKVNYPDFGTYSATIKAKDANGNIADNTIQINIPNKENKEGSGHIALITLPENQNNENNFPEVFVGKQLNNEVLFYIKTDETIKHCFVDSDINIDSNHDGNTKNDKDFSCDKIFTNTYIPSFESIVGRIFYQTQNNTGNRWNTQDFLVSFADFENGLDEETKQYYSQISELINGIDVSSNIANSDLRSLLILLRNNLNDKNGQRGSIIQIEEFLENQNVNLSKKQKEKLDDLMNSLSDYATLSAKGAGVYEISKEEILSLLPLELKKKILNGFSKFEASESSENTDSQTKKTEILETISATIYQSVAKSDKDIGSNEIANDDYHNIVKPNICKIANEHGLITRICNEFNKDNPDYKEVKNIPADEDKEGSGFPKALKILLWVVGTLVIGFIGLIVAFAIKAKLREKYENEEDEA